MPSNPGNPGCPNGSVTGCPARSITGADAGPPVRSGSICCAPNRPRKPAYPPGSVGKRSSWPAAHRGEPWAQWIARPTRSVWASMRAALPAVAAADACASANCGEPMPNTLVTSPLGPVPVFSRTMLALAMAPTSQPARVNGVHGAGTFEPSGPTMFGMVVLAAAGSVQYPNELGNENAPVGDVRT